jgi:hypothetical protein
MMEKWKDGQMRQLDDSIIRQLEEWKVDALA